MATIAETIRRLRMRRKKTLRQLAEEVGSTAASISRYESGKMNPSTDILLKLLGLSEDVDEKETFHSAVLDKVKGQPGTAWDQALSGIQESRRLRRAHLPPQSMNRLLALVREAEIFLRRSVDVHPALVKILRLYRQHAAAPTTREVFQKAVAYIEVELRGLSGRDRTASRDRSSRHRAQ